ncbi:MAG: AsmA family protein, partial [Woeseiaceae bacterium]|nr:AsmA family protein [Woeseiaceae bacterium]
MGRTLKFILYGIAALVALLVVVAVSFALLFDPNDYRDTISERVREATGRELVIEGDLDVSLFPWLAIDVGATRLGNADGFGDQPFAEFERARLSVRLLPLLLRRDIAIGTAELRSLSLNLQVKRDGTTNWQDLAQAAEEPGEEAAGDSRAGARFDVAGLSITNASIRYDNAQLGERYTLSELNLETGAVEAGRPVSLDGGFAFRLQPAETTGRIDIDARVQFAPAEALVRFDDLDVSGAIDGDTAMTFSFSAPEIVLQTEERSADVGEIRLSVLDVDVRADVEPFSYADSPKPVATIRVDAFSPRSLMRRLDIEVPPTADPDALTRLIIDANATVTERTIRLSDLELTLDDTRFDGALTIPRDSGGTYQLDLAAGSIDLNRYMAPADAADGSGSRASSGPVEIPVELIRALNARGSLTVKTATLGRMRFDDVTVGVNSSNGQLRMHPLSAQLFDGAYQGDIRINAAGSVPVLSVNERIENVSLGALAKAMYQRENVTGQINGSFRLEGRGSDMAAIQKTLAGNMSFVLSDGTWHGTDVWYQLRRARALFRRETPPEPTNPPKTRFSEVSATGVVKDGVLNNNDFTALLPFMRLTGRGTVDFPTATIDYSLTGRLVERPEFATAATEAELADMTRVVIPLKITGPLTQPKFAIDFGEILRKRAEDEIRDRVIDRLLGGDDKQDAPADG